MNRIVTALALAALLGAAAPVRAFVPQTIVVDGVNDFDPSNLLNDDRGDTQTFSCSGNNVLPLDLGRVYVTNDASFLYIGIEQSQTCFCDMNLGIAFDVNTAAGGTTDPFGRSIGWANVPFKPDYVLYDVTPTSCNTFNYEVMYQNNAGTWNNISTSINPSWGSGSNGLGIVDSLNFKEMKLPLSVFGVSAGSVMHLEMWVTQEGATKGPLDALASDDVQMSRVGQTTFDTTAVVQMTHMLAYTVLNAVDVTPPTVSSVRAVNFPLLANKQFNLLTNKVDVTFSEPVELASSQVSGNYAFSGPTSRTVIGAVRDAVASSIVHLTLNSVITANAEPFAVTVTNVKDVAGNTLAANGTTNVGSFFIQNLVFNGDFRLGLCSGAFAASDTFAVEGSLNPLTFALCDNAVMTDANADSIYTVTVPFCLPVNSGTGKGEADLGWKFSHKCSEFEPLSDNRHYHLTSDNGASVAINAPWNNDDPANYTSRAMDVVFQVDASRKNPVPSDVITLLGGDLPLKFSQPGVPMLDNGVAPDAVAGDHVYTARVRFPSCSLKNLGWKVDFNGVIECATQGNRAALLNDGLYTTTTPLVLAARGIDRCEVTDKPVSVIFRVNMDAFNPLPTSPADTVAVMGDQAPLRFDYPQAAAILRNDGLPPDAQAGDVFFGRTVTFPDSTFMTLGYKYWKDGVFECLGVGNRTLVLDDVHYSALTPQVSLGNRWDFCTDVTGVTESRLGAGSTAFAVLRPVMPNPVSHRAVFSFQLLRAGHVSLSVYDVTGRRMTRLLDAALPLGVHTLAWDGHDAGGAPLESGVYLYELAMGGHRVSRRMILTR